MTRAALFRAPLILALTLAIGAQGALAQSCSLTACPPPNAPSPQPSDSNRNIIWYIVGGVAGGIIALFIGSRLFPPPERGLPPLPPSDPPPPQQANLPPPVEHLPAPRAKGLQSKVTQVSRNGFNLPPPGETRFVKNEVMLDIPANVSEAQLEAIARRHSMTRVETQTFRLTGRRLHRWRLDGGGTVPDMIRGMMGERQVAGAQPIYLFTLAQGLPIPAINADQYAPQKLNLPEAHKLATGARIVVAIIDSGIDANHPDLSGAILRSFDAAGSGPAHPHGTGMAGALAARRTVLGVAPRVGLLAVRAFDPRSHSGEGTTFNIIKGLDWSVENGARIINMSFAGPADPRLRDAIERAHKKGVVLIAAAGNAGPKSPPLYPAADANVIAVTATDVEDAVFTGANRGNHIAVAAPGVEVLVPAPGGGYQFTTGTSVAAAHVSGVAALLIERNPRMTPADVRRILTRTAKSLGPRERTGAGLVDALSAVSAASSAAAARNSAAAKTK